MMKMIQFVCVLLVALVGSRLVEADLTCDAYFSKYYVAGERKCWDVEMDATFNDGLNLMRSCDSDGWVSGESL